MGRRDILQQDALVGVHVLVVDDEPDARELLRTVLEYCGALVSVVGSAVEAMRILQRVTPDVLLADIAMPQHDGYWLIHAVRGLPVDRGGQIPVVAMTAHGESHGPERTVAAGFRAHMSKPLDPWELCRVLSSLARKE